MITTFSIYTSFPFLNSLDTLNMTPIEIIIFLTSLCLPIWMGDMIDYAKTIEDLFELLSHEDEIMKDLHDFGYI